MSPPPDLPEPIGSDLVRDEPDMRSLVIEFLDGIPKRLERMVEAVRAADFEALRTAAHQLKGSGGGYGYPLLTETAEQLERDARNQAIEECVTSLTELQELCKRLVVEASE